MAAADLEQISNEVEIPLAIPRMRTVAEELAACQQLFYRRDSRKVIEPIYERKNIREQKELKNLQEMRRQRQMLEKKIKVRRSPSLPPIRTSYMPTSKSPRPANVFRK